MTDLPGDGETRAAAPLVGFADQLNDLVRLMYDAEDGDLPIDRLLAYAAAAVPGCEQASVIFTGGQRRPETLAASGELARRLEQLELDTGEGPCLEALLQSDVVLVNDLARYSPWPVFGPKAVEETGVRSIMGFRLFLTDNHRGALNLYSTQPGGFGDDALATGAIFASYVSLALSNRIHENARMNLERALESNREIGMALGILVARELWTPEQAFDRLVQASQRLHRKLRDLAADVVQTGELPT